MGQFTAKQNEMHVQQIEEIRTAEIWLSALLHILFLVCIILFSQGHSIILLRFLLCVTCPSSSDLSVLFAVYLPTINRATYI